MFKKTPDNLCTKCRIIENQNKQNEIVAEQIKKLVEEQTEAYKRQIDEQKKREAFLLETIQELRNDRAFWQEFQLRNNPAMQQQESEGAEDRSANKQRRISDENKSTRERYVTSEGFELSDEQIRAFKKIYDSKENCFITGKAGTGKSVVLRYFVEQCKSPLNHKEIAVLAPTGIAAINVKGQTIHSFFCLGMGAQDTSKKEAREVSELKRQLYCALDVLVIDEISMVRADLMDAIDVKLRSARGNDLPFGGCQIVAFGDLYQLPPVISDKDNENDEKEFIYDKYGSKFFFAAPGYIEDPFAMIELKEVHRQSDPTFINILNKIREGIVDTPTLKSLNARLMPVPENETIITLTPKKSSVDKINKARLQELPTEEHIYYGSIVGDFKKDETPTEMNLTLKVGAQVIMLQAQSGKPWVNGTMAVVSRLENDSIHNIYSVFVKVDGVEYPVDKGKWQKYKYVYNRKRKSIDKSIAGSFEQFPIKLAYAMTIHKSQGQTYNKVNIDYDGGTAFAAGQTYVALSRCRSLNGLYLAQPIESEDIKTDQEVIRFMNLYKEMSNVNAEDYNEDIESAMYYSNNI